MRPNILLRSTAALIVATPALGQVPPTVAQRTVPARGAIVAPTVRRVAPPAVAPAAKADPDVLKRVSERLGSAQYLIDVIRSMPDKGVPGEITAKATCVVTIPAFKTGAFAIGAQYGQGVATCRTNRGWSAPVMVQLTGGNFGFQIGGQATDILLVGITARSSDDILTGKLKLTSDLAVGGIVGRHDTTAYPASVDFLTYTRTKGVFAGADLSGAMLSENDGDTQALYAAGVTDQAILQGNIPTPIQARPFTSAVALCFARGAAAP